jgi:hypothetical protein
LVSFIFRYSEYDDIFEKTRNDAGNRNFILMGKNSVYSLEDPNSSLGGMFGFLIFLSVGIV